MDVWTTQPGIQLYLPNNEKPMIGKGGAQYIKRGAFCLETQHFANAPNIPAFPTTELKPGKIFYQVTEFRFSRPIAAAYRRRHLSRRVPVALRHGGFWKNAQATGVWWSSSRPGLGWLLLPSDAGWRHRYVEGRWLETADPVPVI